MTSATSRPSPAAAAGDLLPQQVGREGAVAAPPAGPRHPHVLNRCPISLLPYAPPDHARAPVLDAVLLQAREGAPLDALHADGRLRPRTCRSSCAATAVTSRTPTDGATSTRSPVSSRSTSATRTGEMGEAALEQMRELPFYTNWTYAHPRAIELAAEVTSLAPGDLNRAFFVSGGSEAWSRPGSSRASSTSPAARSGCVHGSSPPPRGRSTTRSRPASARRPPLQGDHAADRLPRDDLRRALADRDSRDPRAVRAARARGAERPQHQQLSPAGGRDRGGVPPPTCWTSWSGRSRRWGPRPSASCTWSRCRTRAARSRRRSGTGRAFAAATATTSSSPPTR